MSGAVKTVHGSASRLKLSEDLDRHGEDDAEDRKGRPGGYTSTAHHCEDARRLGPKARSPPSSINTADATRNDCLTLVEANQCTIPKDSLPICEQPVREGQDFGSQFGGSKDEHTWVQYTENT